MGEVDIKIYSTTVRVAVKEGTSFSIRMRRTFLCEIMITGHDHAGRVESNLVDNDHR